MTDTRSESTSVDESIRTESTVLDLLVAAGEGGLWAVAEVGREIEHELKAADALNSLQRAGLVHRPSDGFVTATRAAIRASELRL
jgi:hypothetical protein